MRSSSREQKKAHGRKRRTRRRLSPFAWFLVVLIVLSGSGAAAAYRFLRISSVEVTGKTRYTTGQILQVSGVHAGDRLFSFNRQKAAERLSVSLPYLRNARITYRFPAGITITVTQDTPFLLVKTGKQYSVLDSAYKVLENAQSSSKFAGVPIVTGVDVKPAQTGQTVPASVHNRLQQAAAIYSAFQKYKVKKIRSIDVGNTYELKADYDGRITVLIGTDQDVAYKISFASALLGDPNKISDKDKGTLDVSQCATSDKASFIPS